MIKIKRLTGPWLIPYTPDCDYNNGEELLTPEKIEQIHSTFKNYNIIDYEHQFTMKNSPYFLQNFADSVTTWISTKENTFTDITGETITTPPGTLWGSVIVEDPFIEQHVDEGLISAFSVTVAEKSDADKVMLAYQNKYSFKADVLSALDNINKLLSTKRVLIKDIKEPVLLTTTLTGLPCVNKAKFCISTKTVNKSMEENIMPEEEVKETITSNENVVEETREEILQEAQEEEVEEVVSTKTEPEQEMLDEDGFFETVRKSINKYRNYQKSKEEKELNQKEVNELLDSKLAATTKSINEELAEVLKENNKSLTEAFKSELEKIREEKAEQIKEAQKETEEIKEEVKGKGGKAHKSKEDVKVTPSNQLTNNSDNMSSKSYHQKEINERDYLYKFIKGEMSTKSGEMPNISYKNLSILPEAVPTAPAFSLIHPALKDSFSASFTEQGTQKLIFNTQQFGLYMRQLLSIDPLMQDANFRIDYQVSDEERKMYAIRYDEDPTQDGAMEDHYYFDNPNLTAAEMEVSDKELKPETVRALVHISDKQLRNNVFGDSLLDNALGLVKTRYDEGISRITYFSDTELESTEDIKFRRKDGLLKQAGVTLESDEAASGGAGDFDYADGVEKLVRDMFRALPYEAQKDSIYNLYVPPFVYDDYRQYYLKAGEGINFIGNITEEIPLKYNKISVKEAPILADPKGIELYGDKVPILLTSPQNTHFSVGRAMGIEPERQASTGSTKYWFTGDFDCKFALEEYAVVANLDKDEYEAL